MRLRANLNAVDDFMRCHIDHMHIISVGIGHPQELLVSVNRL